MSKAAGEPKRALKDDLRLIARGLGEIRRLEPGMLAVLALRALVDAAEPMATLFFSARILNELLRAQNAGALVVLAAWAAGTAFALAVGRRALDWTKAVKRSRLNYAEPQKIAQIFYETDFENLENPGFQNRKRDYTELSNMYGPSLGWALGNRFENLIRGFLSAAFSAWLAAPLLLGPGSAPVWSGVIVLAVIASSLLSMHWARQETRQVFKLEQRILGYNRIFRYLSQVTCDYSLGKEIRLYHESPLIQEECRNKNVEMIRLMGHKVAGVEGKYQGRAAFLSAATSGLFYLYVALRALNGAFGAGLIVQYVGAINRFGAGFTEFVIAFSSLREHTLNLRYYFSITDVQSVHYRGTLPVEKRDDNDYCIEFRNVSFRYSGSEQYAVKNLSFALRIGEKLAVVGRNGSGKSTMIKLLCRLYDPTEGVILLNGIDIRKYNPEEYRSIFSVVFQDFRLFPFSLGQNVATSVDGGRGKAEECLIRAGLELTDKFPRGLDTKLFKNFDEDGVEVSGGEKQKIALARALYKNAPFLVLDEPTAALDPIAEFEIYSRFSQLAGDKTAVYISHRLASCRFCDDIAVFDGGTIVQRGPHDQLLAEEDGLYARLWNAQAQYYEEHPGAECP